MEAFRPQTTVWLFAIGWAAVRATRVSHRLLLTVAAACGSLLPGFFDDQHGRKLLILGGLLLLIWVTRIPVPATLRRTTAVLASASLWIYLTQPLTLECLDWVGSLFGDPSMAIGSGSGSGSGSVTTQSGFPHELRMAAAVVIALVAGVLAWKAYEAAVRRLTRLRKVRSTAQDPAAERLVIQRRQTWRGCVACPRHSLAPSRATQRIPAAESWKAAAGKVLAPPGFRSGDRRKAGTVSSASSAITMVVAPRAWISRILLSSLECKFVGIAGGGALVVRAGAARLPAGATAVSSPE